MTAHNRRDRNKRIDLGRVGEAGDIVALVCERFSVPDFNLAAHAAEKRGFHTTVASTSRSLVAGRSDGNEEMNFVVDVHPDSITADDHDALIIPGGPGVDTLMRDPDAKKLVKAFIDAGKPVCALGEAVAELAALTGKDGVEGDAALALNSEVFAGSGETAREDAVEAFANAVKTAQPNAA